MKSKEKKVKAEMPATQEEMQEATGVAFTTCSKRSDGRQKELRQIDLHVDPNGYGFGV